MNSVLLDNFAKDLLRAKISFVTSAGNDYVDSCTASPNNVVQGSRKLGMISVGATNMEDSRAAYSNYGSCITIFAPGTGILSTGIDCTACYATMTGTSQVPAACECDRCSCLPQRPTKRPSATRGRLRPSSAASSRSARRR